MRRLHHSCHRSPVSILRLIDQAAETVGEDSQASIGDLSYLVQSMISDSHYDHALVSIPIRYLLSFLRRQICQYFE